MYTACLLGTCIYHGGPPGVLESWGEGLFIYRELGSTNNYFRGAGEQALTFDLESTAKTRGPVSPEALT